MDKQQARHGRIKIYFTACTPLCLFVLAYIILRYAFFSTTTNVYIISICFVTAAVFFGIFLYMMRREARLVYGILEVLFAVGTITGAVLNIINLFGTGPQQGMFPWTQPFTAAFLFFASVYVLVRGLDNVGEGLRKYPRAEEAWNNIFPKQD